MSHNCGIALRLARAGLDVFPCTPDRNKKPSVRGSWRENSTTDEKTIKTWWGARRTHLVAIDLHKAGLLVLDGDRHADEHGEILHDGIDALRALFRDYSLKDHPVTMSAGGGVHVYSLAPPGFGNATGDLPPGIDVRGSGGYVVAPGCVRPDGRRYGSLEGHPDLVEAFIAGTIPVLPTFVQEIIKPPRAAATPITITVQQRGGRRGECFAAAALNNIAREISAKPRESGRNNCLNGSAFRLGRMVARDWIDRSEVERVLFEAATSCALVKDTGAKSVRATIASGLNAGILKPHADLEDR
jgi:Bifunctional DNA primase/polymerase, N-terminal